MPIQSMTGYGRGEALREGTRFTVELQSVNRKQSDISIALPRTLQSLEGRVRELLQSAITRGRLNVSVSVETPPGQISASAINQSLASAYAAAMHDLKARLNLAGEVTLDAVLRAPGVLLSTTQELEPEASWPAVENALQKALHGLLQMRRNEGAHLASDLQSRLSELREHVHNIRQRSPELPVHYRKQLLERIQTAGLSVPVDEERIAREVVLFADRSDISEELTRLESHALQFEALLQSSGPIGRTLEFLTQEIARELNTLSTKSCDAQISQWVVQSKAELEKIREQIHNIE